MQYYPSSFYKYLQGTCTWCDWDKHGNNFCPRGRASIISFLSPRRRHRRNVRGRITDRGCELSSPDRTSSSSTPSPPPRNWPRASAAIALQLRARLNRESFFFFFLAPVAQLQTARINLATSTVQRCLNW